MVKEAVGMRAAELLVEEDEQQGDLGSFVRKTIGVTLSVAGQQAMRLEFAQVVAKLIEAMAVRFAPGLAH
jgi:hypothetical protein